MSTRRYRRGVMRLRSDNLEANDASEKDFRGPAVMPAAHGWHTHPLCVPREVDGCRCLQ